MNKTPEQSIFDILLSRNFKPVLFDDSGRQITDPRSARMMRFDFEVDGSNYGTVVLVFDSEQNLQVFYGDNVGNAMEGEHKREWFDFLGQLKDTSRKNLLGFKLLDISKLKYYLSSVANINESLFEGYYGTRKMSYSDQPKSVKLVIKHNKTLGEGDARFRYIESLFVETADGERFKVPSRSLTHGRMLARHVAEGGNPYDAFGQHITEMVKEMAVLNRFLRAAKHRSFGDDGQALVETAVRHYHDLKAKAKRMISQRGYHEEFERFNPNEFTDQAVTAEAVRDLFVEQTLDGRIEEALPILARIGSEQLTKEEEMKEIDQFECWTNRIMEGTWALPETPEQIKKLKDIMSKPLEVGPDAINATEQLYDILGDDTLFDDLADLSTADPEADARPLVQKRLEQLGLSDLLKDQIQSPAPAQESVQETVETEIVESQIDLSKELEIIKKLAR